VTQSLGTPETEQDGDESAAPAGTSTMRYTAEGEAVAKNNGKHALLRECIIHLYTTKQTMYSRSKILNFRSLPVPAHYRHENAKYLSCMELLDWVISEEDRMTLQTNKIIFL
jgi:hypothetical protein